MDLGTRTNKVTSKAWAWRLSPLTMECAETKFLNVSNDPQGVSEAVNVLLTRMVLFLG